MVLIIAPIPAVNAIANAPQNVTLAVVRIMSASSALAPTALRNLTTRPELSTARLSEASSDWTLKKQKMALAQRQRSWLISESVVCSKGYSWIHKTCLKIAPKDRELHSVSFHHLTLSVTPSASIIEHGFEVQAATGQNYWVKTSPALSSGSEWREPGASNLTRQREGVVAEHVSMLRCS